MSAGRRAPAAVCSGHVPRKSAKSRAPCRSHYPVSYAILQLARTHRAYAAGLLREIELFPSQELVLMSLAEKGPQKQSELVEYLCFDHSTVAKSLGRMESAGWIAREVCEEDRRVTMVSLTKKGEALGRKIDEAWAELERTTVAALSPAQRKQLVELMASVEAHIAGAARA